MLNGVLPRLVSTMVFGALLVATDCAPKPSDVAERLTAVPRPFKLTPCGLLGSLSPINRVAARTPAAVGWNIRLTVQLPRPATLPPATHVDVDRIAKSPAFVRGRARGSRLTTVRLAMLSEVLPRFVSVTVCGALRVPMSCAPKLSDIADSLTAIPVPVRLMVCGLPGALSVNERLPEAVPAAVGVKVTATVQDPDAATGFDVEQVVPEAAIAKGPVTPIAVKLRLALPVLVTITGCELLVVPTN